MASPTIIFTTAYVDIGRGNESEWSGFTRTHEKYIEHFNTMIDHGFEYELVVYTHKHLIDSMRSARTYPANITFVDAATVDTFLKEPYISKETAIMSSPDYKKKIPAHRSIHISYTQPKYTLLTHSKVCFLRNTKILYPTYTYYSWIDFGYPTKTNIFGWPVCTVPSVPRNINFSLLERKIHCGVVKLINYVVHEYELLNKNYSTIYAFSFIVHADILDELYTLYIEKVHKWQHLEIADDEQNVLYQIYQDRKDLFKMFLIKSVWGLYPENLNTGAPSPTVLHPTSTISYAPNIDLSAVSHISIASTLEDYKKPLLLCYHTPHEDNRAFIKSLQRHGWDAICFKNRGTSAQTESMLKVLNTLPASKQIVLVQGCDTLCCRPPTAFIDSVARFKRYFITSTTDPCNSTAAKRTSLHSDLITATVSDLCELLWWGLENKQASLTDTIKNYVSECSDRVCMDTDASIFHASMYGVHSHSYDAPTFAEIFGHSVFFLNFPDRAIRPEIDRIYTYVTIGLDMAKPS